MLIRKRIPKKCRLCENVIGTLQDDSYGCDGCGKSIDDLLASKDTNRCDHLRLDIFFRHKETQHLQFCSWRCVVKRLQTIRSDYFVSLPFLHFERDVLPGQH